MGPGYGSAPAPSHEAGSYATQQDALPGGAPGERPGNSPGRRRTRKGPLRLNRISTGVRSLRARLYYTALDAVYTAPTREQQPPDDFLREALDGESSNFDRVGAIACYLSARAPRCMALLQRALERVDELPLRVTGTRPMAYGTVTSCVLLGGSPPRVLKFLRGSLGRDLGSILRMSRTEREDYEALATWYRDIPRLLPPTIHVVLRSPMRGAPASAQIQELIVGDTSDLLNDHTDEQLIELLERHPELRRHFRSFVAATRAAWDREGRFLDMVGRNNLLLLPLPTGPELRLADFGIWDLEQKRRDRPDLYERAVATLERIERIDARAR